MRARIARSERVVFEGAQGVLLDETWGFHPHTTWSDCTFAGALALSGDRPVHRLGVTRTYAHRHGPGPFPTEGTLALGEPHNRDDGWQGRFRVGALDGVLLRYAVAVCGGVDGLVVTHLDRLERGPVCDGYLADVPVGLATGAGGRVRELVAGPPEDLGHRERLGRWLTGVRVALREADLVSFVEGATEAPVWLESRGPTASAKSWRPPFGVRAPR